MALGVETILLIFRMSLSSLASFTRSMNPIVLVMYTYSYSSQTFIQTRQQRLLYFLSESEMGLLWANTTHGNAGVHVADIHYGFRSNLNLRVGHRVVNFVLCENKPCAGSIQHLLNRSSGFRSSSPRLGLFQRPISPYDT